jgi:hypothetical protein
VGNIDTTGPEKGYKGTNMKKLLTLGMAAALLASACAVHAYPTLTGFTGLIQAPTAHTIGSGMFDVALDYYATKDNDTGAKDSIPVRALYGVAKGLEVGFAYDSKAYGDNNFWDVNAKYMLPYNFSGIKTAVGALYGQANTDPKAKVTEVYLVGTDDLNLSDLPIALTLGVNWAQIEAGDKNSGFRVQGGIDAKLMKGLSAVADLQSRKSNLDDKNLWSAGLRYMVMPALSVEAGVSNGLLFGLTGKSHLFVGGNYAFGLNGK